MKYLRGAAYGIGALVALLIVVSFFMPERTNSEASIVVNAPPERIFPLLNRLSDWPKWSPWGTAEAPAMDYSFEGPESGVGAMMHWDSPETNGTMTVAEIVANRRLNYTMTMENGNGAAVGGFELTPLDGNRTRVIWRDSAEIKSPPVLNRLMTPIFDSMMAGALQKGLGGLKQMAEK